MLSLVVGALIGAGWARQRISSGTYSPEQEDALYLVCIGRGLGFAFLSAVLASTILNINWPRFVERTTVVDPLTVRVLMEKCDHTDSIKAPTKLTVISPAPDRWHTKLWLLLEARPTMECKVDNLEPSSK